MLGHSYRLVQMSLACEAHSSPRRKFGDELLSLGWLEKRAAMAQTDRTRTGGNVPALQNSLANLSFSMITMGVPELPHVAWLVEEMVRLAVDVLEKDLG